MRARRRDWEEVRMMVGELERVRGREREREAEEAREREGGREGEIRR